MKSTLILSVFFLAVSITSAGVAQAAPQAAATASLGDIARKFRAERAQEVRKPTKVFTNDNLPAGPPGQGVSVSSAMAPSPPAPTTPSASTSSGGHDQKYYREKMNELRHRLELHERELNVLQQKLSQNQMQYYQDPNKTLQQEYTRSDVTKLTGDLNKKKEEIAADQKAMEDLQDQLRREGGNPGWLR